MNTLKPGQGNDRGASCVFIYEHPAAREQALQFFHQLEKQRAIQGELEAAWFSFSALARPAEARQAVEQAAQAVLIAFAVSDRDDLPGEIKLWIESWLGKRNNREGALVVLVRNENSRGEVPSRKEMYLRHTARRAGMDYLLHGQPTVARAIPDSLDSFTERAGQMTSVLDEILSYRPPVRRA